MTRPALPGGEGRVQPGGGDRDAEAAGADQAHAVAAADGQQVGALRDVQPDRDDDEGLDPAPAAFVGHGAHGGGRHGHDRQVDRFGQRGDRWHAGHRLHVRGVRVDRVHAALITGGDDVVQDGPASGSHPAAGPHHRHRIRLEHMTQAHHIRAALAERGGVQVRVPARIGVIVRQVAGQLDHAVFQLAPDAEPGIGEDLLHLGVSRQHGCREGGDAPAAGVGDQVLKQQRADAPAMHVVQHRERDFRLVPVARDLVAGHPGELASHRGQQSGVVGGGCPADPACFLLRGQPAETEETQVGVLRRHGLVHRRDRRRVARGGGADLRCRAVGQQGVRAAGQSCRWCFHGIHQARLFRPPCMGPVHRNRDGSC